MNTKIIAKISLYLLVLLTVLSCTKDDNEDLFTQTPSERVESRITELKNLLVAASGGYKVIYFPNHHKYGGFTFFMKFNTDGTVAMTSDVDSQTDITTSEYEVQLGTSVELFFSTRNHIHKLSDSAIPGLIGSGYEGNSNFQYMSNEAGKITFKEPRKDAILVFEPIQQEDWNQVDNSLAMRQNIWSKIGIPVFQQLTIKNSTGETHYKWIYNSLRQYAKPRVLNADGTVTNLKFGIAYTPEGLVVSPPIEQEGTTFETFIYDEASTSFISKVGNSEAIIGFTNLPVFTTDDVLNIGNGLNDFLHQAEFPPHNLTSPGFNKLITQTNTNLAPFGVVFDVFQLTFNPNGLVELYIVTPADPETPYLSVYNFKSKIKDKKLFLEYIGPNTDTYAGFFEDQLQPLLDFFASTQGLYYENTGTFLNFSNQAGTFTSAQDPSLRIYAVWL